MVTSIGMIKEKSTRAIGSILNRRFRLYEDKRESTVVNGTSSTAEKEKAKQSRRRRSFQQMNLSEGVAQLLRENLLEATGLTANCDAKTKLDHVLQHAKERGLSSEAIFKFFDGSKDDQITSDEFKSALASLDKQRLDLSDDEIEEIVAIFDKNGDRKISMDEFKEYCFKLPGTAWKAEKIREEQQKRPSLQDSPEQPEATTTAEQPEVVEDARIPAEEDKTQEKEKKVEIAVAPPAKKPQGRILTTAQSFMKSSKRSRSFMAMTRSAIVRVADSGTKKNSAKRTKPPVRSSKNNIKVGPSN